MKKVLKVTSTNCRGFEGMTHEIIETELTLKEFVSEMILEDDDELTSEELEKVLDGTYHNEEGFGWLEDGSEDGGYDYEGEETNVYINFL